jgi:hypothetical protein
MKLMPGSRLRSAVSELEVIVVRAPGDEVALTSGGVAMVGLEDAPGAPSEIAGDDGEVQLGKRYADDASGLEVLCTKPGRGLLAVAGRLLLVQDAKPLPASD